MAIDLPAAVVAFIAALEGAAGVQIAVLDRIEKTEEFWVRSAAILCAKTQQPFCDEHVRFMTANTEPMGQSHIIEYDFDGKGMRRVCAIIPPIPDIDPWFISEAYGQPLPSNFERPSSTEAASWLMLYHAAHCLDEALDEREENRAVAMATLGLTLLAGDPIFSTGIYRSPSRAIAVMTGRSAAYWAAGAGERVLMDLWKEEVSYKLQEGGDCYVVVNQNASIDTENLPRDMVISASENCATAETGQGGSAGQPRATVSDANLWLWMYGPQADLHTTASWRAVGAPPMPYTPAKSFRTMEAAAEFVLDTSNQLAR